MKNIIFLSFLLLLLGACSSPRYLSSPREFRNHVHGLVIDVTLDDNTEFLGEIIAANDSVISILPIDGAIEGLIRIPRNKVKFASIIISTTSNNPRGIGTYAGIINLAPIGHGWFGILSIPINLATTISIGTTAAKSTYRMKYPDNVAWNEISKFARFPQGIPEQVDRDQIR